MKINELNSEDKLNATTLDEIKGNGSGLPGGCCMVNFSTNKFIGFAEHPHRQHQRGPSGRHFTERWLLHELWPQQPLHAPLAAARREEKRHSHIV